MHWLWKRFQIDNDYIIVYKNHNKEVNSLRKKVIKFSLPDMEPQMSICVMVIGNKRVNILSVGNIFIIII